MQLSDAIMSPGKMNDRYSPFKNELSEGARKDLAYVFGERVSFDPGVRALYSHDVASLPAAFDMLVKRKAQAVIFARTKGDLRELIDFARKHNVPLTPSASRTSGYGGTVPGEGGVVVDLRAFDKVVAIDAAKMTVTCEPGVRFPVLEAALGEKGLALTCYPTSYAWATIGGFVAQGGAGIGSLEFGPVRESLVEAEVVTPSGRLVRFSGKDLDLVEAMMGTTGFITELTLKVRKAEPLEPLVAEFATTEDAAKAAHYLSNLFPFWSVSFYTPEFVELKQEATGKKVLPGGRAYLVMVLPKPRAAERRKDLETALVGLKGKLLDDKVARQEWEERFNHVPFKRLGPSLVVSEVRLPSENLGPAVQEMYAKVKNARFCVWGILMGKGEVYLISYALDDERRAEFPLALGGSLKMLSVAKKHGGASYGTGLVLPQEARRSLGRDRMKKLKRFKAKEDPKEIMNPGKIIGARVRGMPFVRTSFVFAVSNPLIEGAHGMAPYDLEGPQDPAKEALAAAIAAGCSGAVAEHQFEATTCIQCGVCNTVCPVEPFSQGETGTPKGWAHYGLVLGRGIAPPTVEFANRLSTCVNCGLCEAVCPVDIPLTSLFQAERADLHAANAATDGHVGLVAAYKATGNHLGKPNAGRDAALPEGAKPAKGAATLLFAGCDAALEHPASLAALWRLAEAAGVPLGYLGKDESCEGHALWLAGARDEAREAAAKNLKALAKALPKEGIRFLLTPSVEAWVMLSKHYARFAKDADVDFSFDGLTVLHAVEFAERLLAEGRLPQPPPLAKKALLHAACSDPAGAALAKIAREVLKAVPGLTLVDVAQDVCGAEHAFRVADPKHAEALAVGLAERAKKAGAELVITITPGCAVNLEGTGIAVAGFADVLLGTEAKAGKATKAAPDRRVGAPRTPADGGITGGPAKRGAVAPGPG